MKTIFPLFIAMMLVCNYSLAQTTFNIAVKDCHTVGSANYDTVINVIVGDSVQITNYSSSADVFGYSSNVIPTPTLTSSIPVGGIIHKWKISSTGYTYVAVVQSPSASCGRRVYLSVGIGISELTPAQQGSRFYPCPARDVINIDCTEAITSVELFSVTGRLMNAVFPGDKPFHFAYRLPDVKGCFYLRINNNVSRLILVE
jgi:hypothetical protein